MLTVRGAPKRARAFAASIVILSYCELGSVELRGLEGSRPKRAMDCRVCAFVWLAKHAPPTVDASESSLSAYSAL